MIIYKLNLVTSYQDYSLYNGHHTTINIIYHIMHFRMNNHKHHFNYYIRYEY